MKRILFGVLFALLLSSRAFAFDTVLLNNATGGANSGLVDLRGYYNCSIQITCTSGPCQGTAIMVLQNTTGDPQSSAVVSVTNPVSNQLGYSGPCNGIAQVQLTWIQGTWYGTMTRNK
jgi:hypothetical protein